MKKQRQTNNTNEMSPSQIQALIAEYGKEIHNTSNQTMMSFDQFLFRASRKPEKTFRDVFQLFYDMVQHFVPDGYDEYPQTSDSAGFLNYDMNKLLVEKCAEPFYADRIFANRLMGLTYVFRKGVQNNQIYFFEGPPGSGKSTFLNNLLQKFEEYTRSTEGAMYKTAWKINVDDMPGHIISGDAKQNTQLVISCPVNDHPLTLIPVEMRRSFLDDLIADKGFKKALLCDKEFEWVLNRKPCAFCTSMFNHLMAVYGDTSKVFQFVFARRMEFSRHFGKGVSVYNPGDPPVQGSVENKDLQKTISRLFSSDEIPYVYSYLAYTNNGILALMDIKEHNKTRLMNLHGIVSDGVHKVNHIEEHIRSLFLGVINPEDTNTYENIQSFKDRIVNIRIPYVLDYSTEVNIWKHKFGAKTTDAFMPRVLANFAKVIVSTRMLTNTSLYDQWLSNPAMYKNYIDDNLLLLKMELYSGKIPSWLDEVDVANFKKEVRKRIISETEQEGSTGVSGRQSLNLFNKFVSKQDNRSQSISMPAVLDFVKNDPGVKALVPAGFADAIFNLWEYNILDEVKDSIYFYNETKMKRDIKNYLYALNFEQGEKIQSHYTGDAIEINEDFYGSIEPFLFGEGLGEEELLKLRKQEHITYITQTLSEEIKVKGLTLEKTMQYEVLLKRYADNLKTSVLIPFENNDHFKRCVESFNTPTFNKFENPLKKTVSRLIDNMVKKFGYTEDSAIYIVLYVLENKLNERFKHFGLHV